MDLQSDLGTISIHASGDGGPGTWRLVRQTLTLRVQVPNNQILAQNLYYNYYYPNPKYSSIGYLDP